MARSKEFCPDEALQSALEVFWRKGYEATSMRDLLEHTKLHKASLYQTFGNKECLFISALKRFCISAFEPFKAISKSQTPLADLKQMMLTVCTHSGSNNGCMLANTAAEVSTRHASIAAVVQESVSKRQQILRAILTQAQEVGELSIDADVNALADYLNTFLMGFGVMMRMNSDKQQMEQALDAAFTQLK